MNATNPLDAFRELAYYSAHFMDPVTWEPYVREICQRQGISFGGLTSGVAGTYPTFIIEPLHGSDGTARPVAVVKFFGPQFEGNRSFCIERELGKWCQEQPLPIHTPAILADGELEEGWWCLVYECVPGVSIGQARDSILPGSMNGIARQVGEYLRCLHRITAGTPQSLSKVAWLYGEGYVDFLRIQRESCYHNHATWNDLPAHLLDGLEAFILPVEQLTDLAAAPHLIHADITADHLLGQVENGHWRTYALIDWGDARTGNILYELVAVHLDLFKGNRHLLHECLEVYDLPAFYHHQFARKALSTVLLHQFPMPPWVYAPHQEACDLHELAERLFGS